jgi:DNA-binding transcriptional ArsR family regulator
MNSNFNRQFILIDFRLLEDRRFLKFLGSSEFATYLVLRRNVWRSAQPHYMGLHTLYEQERKLVCSLTREKIAEVVGVALDNISRHLSMLEAKGVIRRVRTGRQNIYVLGEWVDVKGDSSYGVEWFYMEGVCGVSKSDLMASVRSDLTGTSDQSRRPASDNNRKENTEENTVGNGVFRRLPDLNQQKEKTAYLTQFLLDRFQDHHSYPFYKLVAAKIPESEIRRALAEVKVDGARNPATLFTHTMKLYALNCLKKTIV